MFWGLRRISHPLSPLVIAASSLVGALVFPLSAFGRTTPSSVSKEWLLLLAVSWGLLTCWAVLYALFLQRRAGVSLGNALYLAAACHVPLVACLALAVALYSSDMANHVYLNSPYGQVIFQPLAFLFVLVAPASMQCFVLAIHQWRHVVRALPLTGIVLVATVLRFWNLNWALPALYHWDEHHYIGRAMVMMMTGDLNPHYFQNPSLVIYVDYLLDRLLSSYIQAFHVVVSFFGFDVLDPRGDYLLDLAARSISALFGTLTVAAVYYAGKELFSRRTGIFAAAILAVSLLHVRNSHYATNDVPATFFLAISFLFSARVHTRGHAADYVLAALFGGLATATKYNAGFFWLAIVASHLLRIGKPVALLPLKQHLPLVASVAISVVAFLVGTPFALLDFSYFTYDFGTQFGFGSLVWHGQENQPTALSYLYGLTRGIGLLPLLLACLGAVLAACHQRRSLAILASIPVAYLLFMSTQRLFFIRFAIPLLPFVAVLAGYGIDSLSGYVRRPPSPSVAAVVLLALAIAEPLILSLQHNDLVGRDDTRAIAAAWIEDNLPPDARIAAEVHSRLHSPFCWKGTQMRKTSTFQPSNEDEAAEILSGKFDYVIVGSFGYDLYLREGGPAEALPRLYKELDIVGELVAEFRPGWNNTNVPYANDDAMTPFWHITDRERPGPTIKVYRLGMTG